MSLICYLDLLRKVACIYIYAMIRQKNRMINRFFRQARVFQPLNLTWKLEKMVPQDDREDDPMCPCYPMTRECKHSCLCIRRLVGQKMIVGLIANDWQCFGTVHYWVPVNGSGSGWGFAHIGVQHDFTILQAATQVKPASQKSNLQHRVN